MNAALFPRVLLMVFLTFGFPLLASAHWDVGVSVGFAPPELPVYEQPPCPEPGYIWTPGYWAYANDDEDYYWVPGTWVSAPSPGLLWTPGYWAVSSDEYQWLEGYWAPHVGFYGGINYGFGYFGVGFVGGYWRDRDFYYNRSVTNITNVSVTNIYNSTVVNNGYANRTSFNGGDGVRARPTPTELIAAREPHRGFTAPQRLQVQTARSTPDSRASINHGHPNVAATSRPGLFRGPLVTPARIAGSPSLGRRRAPVSTTAAADRGVPSLANRSAPVAAARAYSPVHAVAPARSATFPPPPVYMGASRPVVSREASPRNVPSAPSMQRRAAPPPVAYTPSSHPASNRPAPATPSYRSAPPSSPPSRTLQSPPRPAFAPSNGPAPGQQRGAAGVQRSAQNAAAGRR